MHPRPSPNHLSSELLILVGKIAIQSAYVDLLLGELLGGLQGVTGADRAKTIHILDSRRKTQESEELIKAKFTDPERTTVLATVKKAGDLLADRNLVLHGIIAYRDSNLSDPLYIAFRGKHVGKDMPFSKDTLEPIFTDLDVVCRELSAVCSKHGYTATEPSP